MDNKQAWERVLAAVEADARRAEALLQSPAEPAPSTSPAPDVLVGVPADWLLPASSAELPSLADMPPVPPELRARIEALRDQIEVLQGELASALCEWRQPQRMVLAGVAHDEPPVYVDRRL
jgi:hypothetical protein